MKRSALVILLALVLCSFLVKAYDFPVDDLKTTMDNAIQAIKDMVSPIFEFILGVSSLDEYFFSRVLLLILLYAVVQAVLFRVEIFRRNRATIYIISIVVSVLGARYMGDLQFIQGVLLPYGTLAIAITFFLPFLIFFWFVFDTVNTSVGRRLAWGLFGVVFIALWIARRDVLGAAQWVYVLGVGLVLFCLVFDSRIRNYFSLHEINVARRHLNDAQRVQMLHDYHLALDAFNRTGDGAARREVNRLAAALGNVPALP